MDYKVRDIGLAAFGYEEIGIAEYEMPGVMATVAKYGPQQPLAGVKITGSLHMTIQTAVLIRALKALGADVRWAKMGRTRLLPRHHPQKLGFVSQGQSLSIFCSKADGKTFHRFYVRCLTVYLAHSNPTPASCGFPF